MGWNVGGDAAGSGQGGLALPADRIGFHKDGYFKDIVYVNGEPASMVHYGFCRPKVEEQAEEPVANESLGIDGDDTSPDDSVSDEEIMATAEE